MSTVRDRRDEQIAREAAQWLERLVDPTPALNDEFSDWVMRSPDHVRHFLQATAVLEAASQMLGYGPLGSIAVAAGEAASSEMRHLARSITHLPEHCRHIVTLRKVYGLSTQEIADRLELSSSAVEEGLNQAVRTLASTRPAGAA